MYVEASKLCFFKHFLLCSLLFITKFDDTWLANNFFNGSAVSFHFKTLKLFIHGVLLTFKIQLNFPVFKNISTYEYIVLLREKNLRGHKGDIESGEISPPKIQPIKVCTWFWIIHVSFNLHFEYLLLYLSIILQLLYLNGLLEYFP